LPNIHPCLRRCQQKKTGIDSTTRLSDIAKIHFSALFVTDFSFFWAIAWGESDTAEVSVAFNAATHWRSSTTSLMNYFFVLPSSFILIASPNCQQTFQGSVAWIPTFSAFK